MKNQMDINVSESLSENEDSLKNTVSVIGESLE